MTIKKHAIKSKKYKYKSKNKSKHRGKYKGKSKKYRNKTKRLDGGGWGEVAKASVEAGDKFLLTTAKLLIAGVNASSTIMDTSTKSLEIIAGGTKDLVVTGSRLTIKIGKQSLKFVDQASNALFGIFNALYITGEFIAIIYFNLLNTCASFIQTQLTDLRQIEAQCSGTGTSTLGYAPCKQLYLKYLDNYYKNTFLFYKKLFITHKKSLIHNKYEARVKLLTLSCKKTWALNEDYNWKIICKEDIILKKLQYQESDKTYTENGQSIGREAFILYSKIKEINKQLTRQFTEFTDEYKKKYAACRTAILTLNGSVKTGDQKEIEFYNTKIKEFMMIYNISDEDACEKNMSDNGKPICKGLILKKGLIFTAFIEPTLLGSNNHLKELSDMYLIEQANKLVTPTPEEEKKDEKIDDDMKVLNDKILKSSNDGELDINRELKNSQSIVDKAFVGTQGAKPGINGSLGSITSANPPLPSMNRAPIPSTNSAPIPSTNSALVPPMNIAPMSSAPIPSTNSGPVPPSNPTTPPNPII